MRANQKPEFDSTPSLIFTNTNSISRRDKKEHEDVHIYYEVFPHTKPDKSDLVTEVVISGNGRDTSINWKNKAEKAIIDLCTHLFKQVQINSWTFDVNTKIWTFIGFSGEAIITGLESMRTQGLLTGVTISKIEDLSAKVAIGRLDKKSLKPIQSTDDELKFKEEDFFYSAPIDQGLVGKALLEKIAPLLLVEVDYLTNENDDLKLKKLYRSAALRLHPDRNNGDGSKMSELNMLWNIFMQRVG